MAATFKHRIVPEAASLELWRVAESGDVDELESAFLRGADVNARNQHGMTALMRAAYHGREQMVRALLARGADPNITRNDKFTALALAAFFGHTETVRILIEHGAKTEVVTRSNTSPRMWARARTFEEVARCLESKPKTQTPRTASIALVPVPVVATAPTQPVPVVATAPTQPVIAATAPAQPVVVKTLKDPPEIWDLVHEEPRTFNARSAFLSRIKSMNGLRVCAVLLVCVACVVGVLVFRRSQARNLQPAPAAEQNALETNTTPVQSIESVAPPVGTAEAELATSDVTSHHAPQPLDTNTKPAGSRKFYSTPRQNRSRPNDVEIVVDSVEPAEAPVVAPPSIAAPRVEPPPAKKPSTTTNQQVVTPSKSAPPKGKVIQWP